MASPGEYILPRTAVNTDTLPMLEFIRQYGRLPYAIGGLIRAVHAIIPGYSENWWQFYGADGSSMSSPTSRSSAPMRAMACETGWAVDAAGNGTRRVCPEVMPGQHLRSLRVDRPIANSAASMTTETNVAAWKGGGGLGGF
jgi:hypothetical protein